jgi:hypothetical protein
MVEGGDAFVLPVRRHAGRNEIDLAELKLLRGGARHRQVSLVDWIESSAE